MFSVEVLYPLIIQFTIYKLMQTEQCEIFHKTTNNLIKDYFH